MTARIYVPRDTTALALGADAVATALAAAAEARGENVEIVRNGSRGLFWLEPLVEVEATAGAGRVAYGPVGAGDIDNLVDAGLLRGARHHPLCQGLTEHIPYLAEQQRLTFARAGVIDPLSLDDYLTHGGFKGLQKALSMSPRTIIDEVRAAGLRGRGGAAFPTGIKWQTVLEAPLNPAATAAKYLVCNADEGDSGSFADRLVMEADPFMLIEGMLIAALAVGASRGYIYLRSEYPNAHRILERAIALAEQHRYLGANICGSDKTFHLEVRLGAGSYICGEETALLESLEGRRGEVRAKPPLPAVAGLFGQPTAINNVLTLAAVPFILAEGAAAYTAYGSGRSSGTMAFQLAGNIARGGLVELAFGATLSTLLQHFGGGTASGRAMRAVQVGGPLGAYLPASQWDTPLDYEAFAALGALLGHGGIVAFDDSADMAAQARFAMEFCALESCGKCTPCRIGSTRGVEVIERLCRGDDRDADLTLLRDLCDTLADASLCAMGGMTPYPVRSAIDHFPADFGLEPEGHDHD
ncbi:formate dehydrogenase [Exilibacterium tricleocarpae]|uniref:NADH-quinone oxidoreductase subunit F n=1 Tax=Exilibacterium tricleocarpae TaxID=2591008 RepID=A0A545SS39_9GAMM|nr:formate dehydrogenase beta subunit [Exilibacterium tricleocarpae]TQV67787.1 formate dehydrogenase [Exilibacterium tricleocarpae]